MALYTNEMSGWYALADRAGIKSRNEWVSYSTKVKNDINDTYRTNKTGWVRAV